MPRRGRDTKVPPGGVEVKPDDRPTPVEPEDEQDQGGLVVNTSADLLITEE